MGPWVSHTIKVETDLKLGDCGTLEVTGVERLPWFGSCVKGLVSRLVVLEGWKPLKDGAW